MDLVVQQEVGAVPPVLPGDGGGEGLAIGEGLGGVNLLSVMVKSPLPSFLPFQVISRSLPLPVLAILNPLNLAPAWLTFISREVPGLWSKSTSTSCMPGRSLPRRAGRNTWNLYGFWLVEISTLATLLPSLSILALA